VKLYGLSCGYWTDDRADRDAHVEKHTKTVVYTLFENEAPRNPKLRQECVDGLV
jgi:hypothetical protein